MAAVPFGQYDQGNQPVHHVLYLFAEAGRPDRTRFWVDKVMRELFTPQTFPGDEDTGSMAAWYIFSSLGFYPVCPGKPDYTLGASFFPRATLHLPNNKTLVIEASTSTAKDSVELNGRQLKAPSISHSLILAGGHLRFT
jgi:putative alpha-1,2-mannosidase